MLGVLVANGRAQAGGSERATSRHSAADVGDPGSQREGWNGRTRACAVQELQRLKNAAGTFLVEEQKEEVVMVFAMILVMSMG